MCVGQPLVEGTEISLSYFAPESQHSSLRAAAREAVKASTMGDKMRYFGLQPFGDTNSAQLGFIAGIGRLPEASDRPIIVLPRTFGDNQNRFKIDYVKMYGICAGDAEVGQHLDNCLSVYPDEEPIEVENDPNWSPLIALAYLKSLHNLVQRHLRRGFVTREQDLRAKVRGQINIGRYVRLSLARSHPEIIPCRFQELHADTLENRILRTALVAARRLLDGTNNLLPDWRLWARQADSALAGAAITRLAPRDFMSARRTAAYRHYGRPLDLAKAVLTRVGFDPNNPQGGPTVRLVPFRLLTYELFERYVEVCLRRCNQATIWAGYNHKNLGEDFTIRPDFIVDCGQDRIIVDAKYKDVAQQRSGDANSENSFRSDVYQVMAYSRHSGVRNLHNLHEHECEPTMAVLVYPTNVPNQQPYVVENCLNWRNQLEHFNSFTIPLLKYRIPVPVMNLRNCEEQSFE